MSTFDLTPRLARESKYNGKDAILFDKSLTGFGLRIHPSGPKVWIVQARIEGRSRRIVIARYSEVELAEARRRARDILARIRAGREPPRTTSAGKKRDADLPGVRPRVFAALRPALEALGTQDGAQLSQVPHPARRLASCRSTTSAPRTRPRGSTRRAGTSPARPIAPSRYCAP